MKRLLALAGAMMMAACGGGADPTSPSPLSTALNVESLSMKVQTPHFQVFGSTTPDATLRAAADRLEAEYARILGDLNVTSHPMVAVRVWQDTTSSYNELTRYFGTRYSATGYITGPAKLRLLAGGKLESAWQSFVRQRYLS